MASEVYLAVRCPLCRAAVGEPCRRIERGRPVRPPHRRRVWLARQVERRGERQDERQGDLFAGVT